LRQAQKSVEQGLYACPERSVFWLVAKAQGVFWLVAKAMKMYVFDVMY
jgi:hypothetical protein